jgi:oxygen-independent coproporphyrinogen-3 oxidase
MEAPFPLSASDIDWTWGGAKASLYIHIPFCRDACGYCDFFSVPAPSSAAMKGYLRAIQDEFSSLSAWLAGTAGFLGWESAYLGGGTPSILPRKALAAFLGDIAPKLGKCLREWTVECNPESTDHELLTILADSGVNRISLGIQSLEDEALHVAGRPCDARRARAALELVSREWKGEASADLILGLPGQSDEGLLGDIEDVAAAGFRHVSLYCLDVEEGTPFALMKRDTPEKFLSADAEADLWGLAKATLGKEGLVRYEVSNFARPGSESVHNGRYWRLEPYFGLGCAAVSTLPLPGGKALRREIGADIDAYARGWELCPRETTRIGPRDCVKETFLMGFRTYEGIDADRFQARFGTSVADALGSTYAQGLKKGILENDGATIRITESALDTLDPFLVDCFRSVDGSMGE